MERVEEFLRGFCATLAAGKMYPVTHPQFRKVVDTTYDHLQEILNEKGELTIGLIEGEIVYENRVLFKLSQIFELLITHSKKKSVEKIYFYPEAKKEELINFVSFLLSPEEVLENLEERLELAGIYHIKASRLTTPEDEAKKKNENQLTPYESALKDLAQFYEKMAQSPSELFQIQQNLKLVLLIMRDKLAGKYRECLSLTLSKSYDEAVIRSLNVGILAITVASKLGFNPEEVLASGNAALLYNIGQLPDGKGKAEPHKSAKILLKYKDTFGILPVVVSFEHGQRQALLEKKSVANYCSQPHIVSMIIGLCESYDGLLKRGGTTQSYEETHRLLAKEASGELSPQLLGRFLKIVKV